MLVMRAVFKICGNESQPGLQPSRLVVGGELKSVRAQSVGEVSAC